MSLSTYFHDTFHEPFFTPFDVSRFFDAAWDGRTPGSRDVQPGRQEPSLVAAQNVAPRYAPVFRRCGAAAEWMGGRMDVHESKDKNEMTVMVELPGVRKEDVDIDVRGNRLVIAGQSALSTTLDREGYVVRERRVGRFSRVLPLPAGTKVRTRACAGVGCGADVSLQVEDIKASMDDGVLNVRFPKTHPEQEPRKKITIA